MSLETKKAPKIHFPVKPHIIPKFYKESSVANIMEQWEQEKDNPVGLSNGKAKGVDRGEEAVDYRKEQWILSVIDEATLGIYSRTDNWFVLSLTFWVFF